MFAKKDPSRVSSIEKSEIKAFLGAGSQFEGRMVFNEIVRLDGHFRGEIISNDVLIVGETADIQAEVSVGTLIISGRLKGNIKAAERVELRAPAQIEGTITAPALSIEVGAVFDGTVSMGRA